MMVTFMLKADITNNQVYSAIDTYLEERSLLSCFQWFLTPDLAVMNLLNKCVLCCVGRGFLQIVAFNRSSPNLSMHFLIFFPLKAAMVLRLYKYLVALVFCSITSPRLSSALEIANASADKSSKNFSLRECIRQRFCDSLNDHA